MKWKRNFLIFLFLVVYLHAGLMQEHVPKYLQNKYNMNSNSRNGVSKSAPPVKSHSKTKAGSLPPGSFKGGCVGQPQAPANSKMTCSKFGGCKITCESMYKFPEGSINVMVQCQDGVWIPLTDSGSIPHCEPICLPECENKGICVSPNLCNCPDNYAGPQCQFENKPCVNFPPMPMNSKRSCRANTCTITCLAGYQFPDASSAAMMECKNGNWEPTKNGWKVIPDCQATCDPPCLNGGNCLSLNVCQCPQDFRGPRCQYTAIECNPKKLDFNGAYNCSGNADYLRCSVSCPEGIMFEYQPQAYYSCLYEKGKFEPYPIPQCIFPDNIVAVPLGATSHTYYNVSKAVNSKSTDTETTWNTLAQDKVINETADYFVPVGEHAQLENKYVIVEEQLPKPGVCFTWGGSHFKTFDGTFYSFSSGCEFTMARDSSDNTFTVIIANAPCDSKEFEKCNRIVKVFFQDKEYILKKSDQQVPVLMSPSKVHPIPGQLPGLRTEMVAHFVVLSLDTIGAKIKWDGHQFVEIEINEALWNRTEGLCSRMDGRQDNDLLLKNGIKPKNIISFVNNWKVNALEDECKDNPKELRPCEAKQEMQDFCSKILLDKKFLACQKMVNVPVLLASCKSDYCNCQKANPNECACQVLDIYIRSCAHRGIKNLVSWRDEKVCPMTCTGGRIYMPCAPVGGQAVCGASVESNEESTCEEGCYCPPGTYLHDNECITKDRCPCRLRGKHFPSGSSVPKDCNTCTCNQGQWLCTQVACGSRCAAIGDPHYITFDGKHYDFMGQCSYYLVKHDNFSVEAENVACSGAISAEMNILPSAITGIPSCTKTVTIRYAGLNIKLKQNHEIIVNGKDITTLPFTSNRVKIRSISSIFLLVSLPNKADIWWDGLTRAYVDAPPSLKGQTQGLCGTFNDNQRDDFLTPENDVETSVAPFANKWKTEEKCNDVPLELSDHPCNVNIQNKALAEKHCKILKSSLFAPCHWFVDPEQFYKDCLYDLCACNAKVNKCFCPMVAAYAQECAAKGAKIPWRKDVQECGMVCPPGQTYQICGNTCTRTCSDITMQDDCRPQCVEGCNCPEGEALDDFGDCIPIGQCKCYRNGLDFPAGFKEVRLANGRKELCTCTNANWHCQAAKHEDSVQFPPVAELQSKCNTSRNFVFTTCESPEPITCKNMHETNMYSPEVCHSGCECKKGYVLNSKSKTCVKPSDCPCHHGGRSYKEKSVVQNDCNACNCKNAKWECTQRQCTAECSAWGDSHFKTFDGRLYDYQGQCDYVLAKGSISSDNSFDVTIQNVPCGSLGVSCSKSVSVKIGSGPHLERITLTRGKHVKEGIFKRFTVRTLDLFVILEAADLGLTVHWDKGTRVYVKVDPRWKSKVKGLCGDYNDNAMDDFQTPSGGLSEASPVLFGDSWKLQNYCPETHEIEDTCEKRPDRKMWALTQCGILKSPAFAACHSIISVEHYLDRCIFDSCACDQGGDCECLCTAIAAYAQECNSKGAPVKWRSQEFCPIQCDKKSAQYSPCISTCPVETCENLLVQSPLSKLCKEDSCIEGCQPKQCPVDEVFANASMLSCIPRSLCKPICMEVDGVIFYEGDLMEEDSCHTCFCSRGIKSCKGHTCPPSKSTLEPPSHEENAQCKSGWTDWLNQDKIDPNKATYSQIEDLPDEIILNNLVSSPKCSKEDMVNIECRTIKTHLSAKETGMDVECSLERGLVCKSEKGKRPCPDFEIRVLCKCEAPPVPCDPRKPNEEFPGDCHKFYQCAPSKYGHALVEKTCGKNMMYNPISMICDWPKNVAQAKPECSMTEKPFLGADVEAPGCEANERFDECAIECDKLCLHYKYIIKEQGLCKDNTKCEPGCVSSERSVSCSDNQLWLNEDSCVLINDCMCSSHDGRPIKPGTVFKESECMICQCIDNYYTCDKTACGEEEQETILESVMHVGYERNVSVSSFSPIIITTVTPPNECPPDMYLDLIQGDDPLPDEAFEASSVFSSNFASHYARIDSKSSLDSGGCWTPKETDNQYLQINLGKMEPIYGVVMKGNPIYTEYVTSFKVMYTTSLNGLWNYVLDHSKEPQTFRGGLDGNTPVQHIFIYPIEAQYVKILPLTWHGNIALRVELIGCGVRKTTLPYGEFVTIAPPRPDMCLDPMGLLDGTMSDQQVTVSSQYGTANSKHNLKLNSLSAWRPVTNSPSEFVVFHLLEPRNITGFVSKGGPSGWVTAFKIMYSQSGRVWHPIYDEQLQEKTFLGNFDGNTAQMTNFIMPVLTTNVKIIPLKWHQNIELRIELNGCFLPYPTMQPQHPEPDSPCNECPGIQGGQLEIDACHCQENLWWDGKQCGTRSACPCIVGQFVYPIGTVFEKTDCSQCICKLGGIEHCEVKSCPKCENGLKTTLTSTCGCICLPCEEGTILCPTSDICINSTSWCDGVQDCPDDELNCQTTIVPTIDLDADILPGKSRRKKKCPSFDCPPGYKMEPKELEKYKHIPTMLSNDDQQLPMKRSSYLSGIKRSGAPKQSKSQLALPPNTVASQTDKSGINECPELKCVPSEPLVGYSSSKCPPVECPEGFKVAFATNHQSKKRCPHYDCVVIPLPDPVCNMTGSFFNTFDGVEFKYDICNHILARDLDELRWEVLLTKNCTAKQFCTKDLIINHDENTFVLHHDLTVEFNGFRYSAAQSKKIGSNSNVFQLTKLGNTLMFASNRFGFWVLWDNNNKLKLGISSKLSQKVDGLCGYYNGDASDDKRKPDGSESRTTAEFGDSWLEPYGKPECDSDTCPPHLQNKAWDMCNQVKSNVLSPCAKLMDVDAFVSRCVQATCSCLEMSTQNQSVTYEDSCRCKALESFVVDCMVHDKELELTDWRTIHDCPVNCEVPLIYKDCYRRRCEPTCETMVDPNACPQLPNMCFPGCYCPPGLVSKDGKCIKSSICKDCECNVLPHLQYITYDNSNFSISGNCVYVMTRDVLEKYHDDHQFQVLITNHPCGDNAEKMCVGKITILYQGHKIHVFYDTMRNKLKLIVDSERVDDFEEIEDWATVETSKSKHMRILLIKVQIHISVYFPSLGVSVKAPSHKYGGRLEGLCGDCNKDPSDDMKSPAGEPIHTQEELAPNWFYDKLPGMTRENCENTPQTICDTPDVDNDPCMQLLDSSRYAQCHPLLDPGMFFEWCHKDICGGQPERACAAISSYARECLSNGFCVNWHSDLCPQQECPDGQEYKTCGTSCPVTCESLKESKGSCVEVPTSGCFCPQDKVMQNKTCVDERMCTPCDTQGHYSGDRWFKDPCTACECEGASIRCETKYCPAVDTICEIGFNPVKLSKEPNECCEKYICIPAATAAPTCDPPQQLDCATGQVAKLDSKPDGCQQFVCECIPPEECEQINTEPDPNQEPGMAKRIKAGGCCKSVELVCNHSLCPAPIKCEEFHTLNTSLKEGRCCEEYACIPPESCIVDLKYIDADDGGERLRSQYEIQRVLKAGNETWSDGPCRNCECYGSKPNGFHSICTSMKCPVPASLDPDYELLIEPVKGQCCPNSKRSGCKYENKIYNIGDKWTDQLDACIKFECADTKVYGVQKLTQTISCDEACDLGFEYVSAPDNSSECCGTCKAVSCVVDGKLKSSGNNWTSDDFCTHFTCANLNGLLQVQSFSIVCAEIPPEQFEQFVFEFEAIEGECCKKHKMIACKVGDTMHMVGQSWPCPEGDKCKTYTCLEEMPGQLKIKESVQTCDQDCPRGWMYRESNSTCCGDCLQYACIDDTELKMPGANWTSENGCTTYTCDQHLDQFVVTSYQIACPLIDDCPMENVYEDGCCKYCNMSALAFTDCFAQEIEEGKTIHLITDRKAGHGICKNKDPIPGFTECVGSCHSATSFNKDKGSHENICSCCHALKYESLEVELTCQDGHTFMKPVSVPSKCSCEECWGSKIVFPKR